MYVMDAFRAFDADRAGTLNCSKLYGGITWLGLELSPDQLYSLMKHIDSNHDGYLSMEDFKHAFHKEGETLEGGHAMESSESTRASARHLVINPRPIKELYEMMEGNVKQMKVDISLKSLKGIKVKAQQHSNFIAVWDSRSIGARQQVSIWAPQTSVGVLQRNRDRMCLGHYAVLDLKDPSKTKKGTHWTYEITDTAVARVGSVGVSSQYLMPVIDALLPHPVRFRQVWNTVGKRTETHLYAWLPIPPSAEFVALGMIGTTDDDAPPLDSVRCVPLKWCKPVGSKPKKLWDDSGTGGKKGSIWIVNSMGLMAATRGHDPPTETFYELDSKRFFMGIDELAMINRDPSQPTLSPTSSSASLAMPRLSSRRSIEPTESTGELRADGGVP